MLSWPEHRAALGKTWGKAKRYSLYRITLYTVNSIVDLSNKWTVVSQGGKLLHLFLIQVNI